MWIVLTYDINEKRVNSIRKICALYLIRVQNSVFLGEIGWANLRILRDKLKDKIIESEDSIQFFILRDEKLVRRIKLGVSYEFSNII
ncbi:CRISPR-associated protein Cas2 [Ferroplasma acidiphilum]|uniref:CRISPR-associated endoribonuclease Cas2 n=1 Tax=Ferroplasma acidiphilum TaxID=74969 RepID=A0A1V0N3T5_9ARCH|nr:CRISPR-associated endonuclease Cas2 [Ferroplasma acidiphilum]ARD84822.1 CRISPR-associated protein Cas2 [Ferroplasma acidiphilum]